MAYVLFLLLCGVWGSSFILMKKATVVFDPFTVGLIRVLGGVAVLTLVYWVSQGKKSTAARPMRAWLLVLLPGVLVPGVLGMAYPFAMQPYLIDKYQDSGFFGMMVCLVPLMTVVARVPLLKVWPTPRELIGVLGGLGFVFLLFADGSIRGMPPLAIALAVTVPAFYAVSNTFVKRALSDYPPVVVTLWAMVVACLLYLPVCAAQTNVPSVLTGGQHSAGDIAIALLAAVVLGVVGTGLATWVFYGLVRQRGPLFAGMVTYLVSGIAVFWGYLDGEPLTARQITALIGILLMVAVVQAPLPVGGRGRVKPPSHGV